MAHVGGHEMQTGTGKKEENTEGTRSGTLTSSVYKSMWETGASRTDVGHKLGDGRISVAVRISGRQGEPGERSDRNSLMTGNVDRDPGGTWGTYRVELSVDVVRGIWTSTDRAAVPAPWPARWCARQQVCTQVGYGAKPQCNAHHAGRVKWRMEPC